MIANGQIKLFDNPGRRIQGTTFSTRKMGVKVLFVENEDEIFLKTIIPSRKATKQYVGDSALLSSRDLRSLQIRALREGMPYQTLASSVLHKFVAGQLVDKTANK